MGSDSVGGDGGELSTISIHAPRVGSDNIHAVDNSIFIISIHAPRVGSDNGAECIRHRGGISIHAPRVGSDRYKRLYAAVVRNFNPRSPCGERPQGLSGFLDTLSISIHAPRVGSDAGRFDRAADI